MFENFEITVPEGYVWILSYTIGYLIVSALENAILIVEKSGTKIRWSLNPFKPYIKKNKAIVFALIQFLIPFVLAMFLGEVIFAILEPTDNFIIPISIIVFTIAYINIRASLPYKLSKKEKIIPAIILLSVSIFFIFMIIEFADKIIIEFRWLTIK